MQTFLNVHKWTIVIALLLSIGYFATRLVNLTFLPIFEDEAIYVRWAQIAANDASWRYISLTDGKQPLLIWLMLVPIKLIQEPLLAGRLTSVMMGYVAMVGIGVLTGELFKSKYAAIAASLLYLVSPYTLVYDRMVLMDTTVAAFYVWSLFLAVLLVRTLRLDVAMILGFSLAGGMLTKSSGFISLYLLPTLLLLFDYTEKKRVLRLLKWAGLVLVSAFISQLLYSILRLSPWFHMIDQKNTLFVIPFEEWIMSPFRYLFEHLDGMTNWLGQYLTPAYIILIIAALVLYKHYWREKLLLLGWFIAPFMGLALMGNTLYPRFLLFMAMPLIVLAAWTIGYTYTVFEKRKAWFFIGIAIVLFYPSYVSSKVLFSVVTAPIPKADLGQYVNDDPSGWGVREIVDILTKEAQDKEIIVFTDGTFGLMPYGLEIYLVDNPNIQIIGIWPPPAYYTQEMIEAIASKPTYYVANMRDVPVAWRTELIGEWAKGNHPTKTMELYLLKESPELPPEDYEETEQGQR